LKEPASPTIIDKSGRFGQQRASTEETMP